MNVTEQLEDLCAAVPPPRPGQLAAARARVMAGPPRRVRHPRRRLGLVAVTAAVSAAAVTAAALLTGTGQPVTLDAAQVLNLAAAAAAAAPVPRNDQFIYTRVAGTGGAGLSYQESWQSADNQRTGASYDSGCGPWSQCLEGLDPRGQHVPADRYYTGQRTLPARPAALLAYLEQHGTCRTDSSPAARAWDEAENILETSYVLPPQFGAALWRALARVPGIRVIPHVRDAAGAAGIAVARQLPATPPSSYGLKPPAPYGQSANLDELIFDARSYRFIGFQTFPVSGHRVSRTAGWSDALVADRFTDSAPAAKPGHTQGGYWVCPAEFADFKP